VKSTQEIILTINKGWALIAVLGSLLAAITVLLSAGWQSLDVAFKLATGAMLAKTAVVELITVIDQFLIAVVFYIVGLGIYELFIGPLSIWPKWLIIRTLDDLKNKLLRLVVVVLAVDFLGEVVLWKDDANILPLGAGIALVIVALTYFLKGSSSESQ